MRTRIATLLVGSAGIIAVAVMSIATPAAGQVAPTVQASHVRTVQLWRLSSPSSDPSGVAFRARDGRMIVIDSEIDELERFDDANVFEVTPRGRLKRTGDVTRFTEEPTGVAVHPRRPRAFITDDDARTLFVVAYGRDGRLGTPDDRIGSLNTRAFGSSDPEDVAFHPGNGDLFVIDGTGSEVYRIRPGRNGVFDGVRRGDDVVTHVDVGLHGAVDPEGIAVDRARDSLLVLDHETDAVYEIALNGVLRRTIELSAPDLRRPAGLAVAPASDGSDARHLFVVDRGVDNNADPNENDGRMFEFSIPES